MLSLFKKLLFLLPLIFVQFIISLFPIYLPGQTPEINYIAYKQGEELLYNIHYGIVNAAFAKMTVSPDFKQFNNKPRILLSTISSTYKTWDLFYPVRDNFYSYLDTLSLYPVYSLRDISEGDYRTKDMIFFNRTNSTIISNSKTYKVRNDLFDILSAVYYARCIDYDKLSLYQEIPLFTFFDNELFPVGLKMEGKTILKTKYGKFRCLIIKPKLVKGRIFKGQYDMTIYITDDLNHLPLKVQTAIFVGYIQADLTSFKNLKYPLSSKIE